MTQTKAHYSKWTLPAHFAASFLPQPSENRCPYSRSAMLLPLGISLGWEGGKKREEPPPARARQAQITPPLHPISPCFGEMTFLHEMSFHDISSYETMGPYSHSMLLSKIIVVMSTSIRGCAVPGRGGTAGYINPLDVVGFTPRVCFTAP